MFELSFLYGFLAGSAGTALLAILLLTRRQSVSADEALVLSSSGAFPEVKFGPRKILTFPWQTWHKVSLGVRTIRVRCLGTDGILASDSVRLDLEMDFYLTVRRIPEDVAHALNSLGPEKINSIPDLEQLFGDLFTQACRVVGRQLSHQELGHRQEEFKNEIFQVCGTDLLGFYIEDIVLRKLSTTPLDQLNPDQLEDAKGIRVLTEALAKEHITTNEAKKAMLTAKKDAH